MIDNDIIKALEICTHPNTKCSDCPFHNTMYDFCRTNSQTMALMLINRQKAEIEELKEDNKQFANRLVASGDFIEKVRTEAIKEFAERLKEQPIKCQFPFFGLTTDDEIAEHFNGIMKQVSEAIDNLVKEMVGERE